MSDFARLIERARSGERPAVGALYERYESRVRTAVRRRLGSDLRRAYDTLDLTHSVFLEVLRDLPRFEERGEEKFLHWLYMKVENKVRSKLRRHLGPNGRRRPEPLDPTRDRAAERSPSSAVGALEDQARARDLSTRLEESTRAVVRLRIEEGLSFVEIARRLGLPSADAARKRFTRAIADLRSHWDAPPRASVSLSE